VFSLVQLRLRLRIFSGTNIAATPYTAAGDPRMIPKWLFLVVYGSWDVLGLVYLLGMVRTKRTMQRQSTSSRSLQLSLTILGWLLLLWHRWRHVPAGWHILPQSRALLLLGATLTVAGCLLAIWARMVLGGNWSMAVTLKQGHTLMTRGPYAWTRHPIYTGLLTAALGTAIFQNEPRCLLGFFILLYAFWKKLHTEEEFMLQQFGAQYVDYQQRVKALIPGLL
jgi:protein-S-isoprenylcysteine O-methyltransferase Ste14